MWRDIGRISFERRSVHEEMWQVNEEETVNGGKRGENDNRAETGRGNGKKHNMYKREKAVLYQKRDYC